MNDIEKMVLEAVMIQSDSTRKPPIADLWLLVDEQQTMHFGLRKAWRWLEAEQPHTREAPKCAPLPADHPVNARGCSRATLHTPCIAAH
jgi:hypothetical protein